MQKVNKDKVKDARENEIAVRRGKNEERGKEVAREIEEQY